ncbi:MAG: creatininase family protein [Anaerolineaceae bacterium]|nr:creatininase family protein [Anaerolineaceae bacterium]
MRFEDINWMEMESYLKHEDRVMLVTGACEQHAYLSLLTDIKIPLAIADAVSQKCGVLVAPPLNYGCSSSFKSFPGTISLKSATIMAVMDDIVLSLYHHGFRRMLVLNGHGGNRALRSRLSELTSEIDDLRVVWYEWFLSQRVGAIVEKAGLPGEHASWVESFNFTRTARKVPPGSKPVTPHGAELLSTTRQRKLIGDGNYGGPYQVDDRIMDEIFNACVSEVLELIEFPDPLKK